MKIKTFCFDLDNTLCKTTRNKYEKSRPMKKKIKILNQLYEKGHIIKIFTARFMGRSNEKVSLAKKLGYSLTKKQLKSWGVKYHYLIMGKPSYDILIDDKSINYDPKWDKEILKVLKGQKHKLKFNYETV